MQNQFQSYFPEIKITLPQNPPLVRERPFALWSEAQLPMFSLAASLSPGPVMIGRESENVVITNICLREQGSAEPSAPRKEFCRLPAHVLVVSVISPDGYITNMTNGPGWMTSRHALKLTGLSLVKKLSCNVPASIPIITPRGTPYVLDVLLGGAEANDWQTVRFVNFDLSPVLKNLVRNMMQLVDRPYVFGGINDFGFSSSHSLWNGKRVKGFDCSGLVVYLYRLMGIDIPWRTTDEQWNNLQPVESQDLLPGDLVFWAERSGRIYHVGIVLGDIGSSPDNPEPDGQWDMLHAPRRNQTVRVEYDFFSGPMQGIAGFRTLIGYKGYLGY